MKQIWIDLLFAFQFLTRIPISGLPRRPGALVCAAKFFPVVGLAIGLMAAAICKVVSAYLERRILAIVLLTYLVLITGGLHEDGLADSADAFGAGWSKQQILAIMRDSRIGSFGAIAIALSVLGRFVLITDLSPAQLPKMLIAAAILCRWTALPLSLLLPYAREEPGLGGQLASRLPWSSAAWGTLFAVLSVAAVMGRESLWVWLVAITITAVSALYFKRKIQGITGDCFGAANQFTEVAIYFYGTLHS